MTTDKNLSAFLGCLTFPGLPVPLLSSTPVLYTLSLPWPSNLDQVVEHLLDRSPLVCAFHRYVYDVLDCYRHSALPSAFFLCPVTAIENRCSVKYPSPQYAYSSQHTGCSSWTSRWPSAPECWNNPAFCVSLLRHVPFSFHLPSFFSPSILLPEWVIPRYLRNRVERCRVLSCFYYRLGTWKLCLFSGTVSNFRDSLALKNYQSVLLTYYSSSSPGSFSLRIGCNDAASVSSPRRRATWQHADWATTWIITSEECQTLGL